MNLRRVSRYFDDTTCTDVYDDLFQFKAQLNVYEDSTRDSVNIDRRILSTQPDQQLPPRRVVAIEGQKWVMGDFQLDTFKGQVVRNKYVLQQALAEEVIHHSLSTYLTQTEPVGKFYAGISWVKNAKQTDQTSDMEAEYQVYTSSIEKVEVYDILVFPDSVYLIEQTHTTTAGFRTIHVESISNSPELTQVTWVSSEYDPRTNSYSDEAQLVVSGLEVRWQSFFDRFSSSTEKFKFGDSVLLISKSGVPEIKPDSKLEVAGQSKMIMGVESHPDFWAIHVRNAVD
jgi:hypothetical protein